MTNRKRSVSSLFSISSPIGQRSVSRYRVCNTGGDAKLTTICKMQTSNQFWKYKPTKPVGQASKKPHRTGMAGKLQTITSPPSIITDGNSSPLLAWLGTTTANGLYRYQPFNALIAARIRASSRLPPLPSPSFSLPLKTPTMYTGCRDCRPVSARIRATGG